MVQKLGSPSCSRGKDGKDGLSSSIGEVGVAVSVEDEAKECIESASDSFLNNPLFSSPLIPSILKSIQTSRKQMTRNQISDEIKAGTLK